GGSVGVAGDRGRGYGRRGAAKSACDRLDADRVGSHLAALRANEKRPHPWSGTGRARSAVPPCLPRRFQLPVATARVPLLRAGWAPGLLAWLTPGFLRPAARGLVRAAAASRASTVPGSLSPRVGATLPTPRGLSCRGTV